MISPSMKDVNYFIDKEKEYKKIGTALIGKDTDNFIDMGNCKVYSLKIPEEIYDKRVTQEFRLVLNKKWAAEHNGDMLDVKIEGMNTGYLLTVNDKEGKIDFKVHEKLTEEQDKENTNTNPIVPRLQR